MGGRIHLPPFTKGIKTQFFQQLAGSIGYHIDTAQMVGVHIAGMQGVAATLYNGIGKGAAEAPFTALNYQLYPTMLIKDFGAALLGYMPLNQITAAVVNIKTVAW